MKDQTSMLARVRSRLTRNSIHCETARKPSAGTVGMIRRYWRKSPPLCIGAAILVSILVISALAPIVSPYSPTAQNITARLQPPSAMHWLGTDQYGRDVFSRMILGGATSILLGFASITLALSIGVPFGLIAGYYGGRTDNIIMRATDILLAFPSLLMALLIITALGANLTNAILAIGLANTPAVARIVRGSTLSIRNEEFVLAARVRRDSAIYIMLREILLNVMPPVVVEATIRMGFAMLIGAGLSFLGLGVQPPEADWGLMMREARTYIILSPWPLIGPGVALAITVCGLNLFGDGLGDILIRRR